MPINIPYEQINDNTYVLNDRELKICGYDCRVQVPKKLGDKLGANRKIKLTIEVLD